MTTEVDRTENIERVQRATESTIEVGEEGELEGYAVTWGFDGDGIRFTKGSFKKTVAERAGKIPLLVKHDSDGSSVFKTVGWVKEGEADDHGLVIRASFLDDSLSQNVRERAKNGGVKGLSINAVSVKDTMEDGVLVSKEAKLREVTLTNIPKDPESEITAVRSEDKDSEADTSEEEPEDTTPTEEPSVDVEATVRANNNLITLLETKND